MLRTHRSLTRADAGTYFKSKLDKFRYVLEISARRIERTAVLWYASIEDATLISELLSNDGVPHRVLNANPKLARKESEIVSQAGRLGAVTIATNMAGRGTDILLGGNAALTARLRLREALAPAVDEMLEPLVRVERSLYPVDDLGAIEQQLQAAAQEAAPGLRQAIFADQDNATEVKRRPRSTRSTSLSRVARRRARRASPASMRVAKPTTPSKVNSARSSTWSGSKYGSRAACRARPERHESVRIDNQLGVDPGDRATPAPRSTPSRSKTRCATSSGATRWAIVVRVRNCRRRWEPLQSDMLTKSLSTIQEKVESYYREMHQSREV